MPCSNRNVRTAFLFNVESHKVGTMRWTLPPLEAKRAAWRKAYPWWPAFDQDVTAWSSEGDELFEAANEWFDERDEADK